MDCTVIICTHNRAEILAQTLRAVAQQEYHDGKLEILVVDNCSVDHTRQVTEKVMAENGRSIRYLYEPNLGLSHARNCGLRYAQGEIAVFLDDDAMPLQTTWIWNLVKAYHDPQVGAAGGDVDLIWPPGGRPIWMHDFLLPNLGKTMFHYTEQTELHYPLYPFGCNISYRKTSIEQLNGFSVRLGRVGAGQILGEETELCLRLEKQGEKIVYVPEAVVGHIVSPEKLTQAWFKRRAFGRGLTEACISRLHASKPRLLFEVLRKAANIVVHFAGLMAFSALQNPSMSMFHAFNLIFSRAYIGGIFNAKFPARLKILLSPRCCGFTAGAISVFQFLIRNDPFHFISNLGKTLRLML
jgi:glycosyltransferase involved in cell wall biosynthesis